MHSETTDFSVRKILGLGSTSPLSEQTEEPPKKRQRRTRTVFSTYALGILETVFTENCYPDMYERTIVARLIGADEARVQVWFQNRRARDKRGIQTFRPIKDISEYLSPSPSTKTKTVKPTPVRLQPLTNPPNNTTYFQIPPYLSLPKDNAVSGSNRSDPIDRTSLRDGALSSNICDPDDNAVMSPIWSPSVPTFSRLFQFPPKAISPLPDSPQKLQSNRRSADERQSDHTQHFMLMPSRVSSNSCTTSELSQSEDRAADDKTRLIPPVYNSTSPACNNHSQRPSSTLSHKATTECSNESQMTFSAINNQSPPFSNHSQMPSPELSDLSDSPVSDFSVHNSSYRAFPVVPGQDSGAIICDLEEYDSRESSCLAVDLSVRTSDSGYSNISGGDL